LPVEEGWISYNPYNPCRTAMAMVMRFGSSFWSSRVGAKSQMLGCIQKLTAINHETNMQL